jgi:hypothetical protein
VTPGQVGSTPAPLRPVALKGRAGRTGLVLVVGLGSAAHFCPNFCPNAAQAARNLFSEGDGKRTPKWKVGGAPHRSPIERRRCGTRHRSRLGAATDSAGAEPRRPLRNRGRRRRGPTRPCLCRAGFCGIDARVQLPVPSALRQSDRCGRLRRWRRGSHRRRASARLRAARRAARSHPPPAHSSSRSSEVQRARGARRKPMWGAPGAGSLLRHRRAQVP